MHLNFFQLFQFFQANQDNRKSAEPCQLNNDWGSPSKMILPTPSTAYVRPAWPLLNTSMGGHNHALSFPWTWWVQQLFLLVIRMGCCSLLETPDSQLMVNPSTFSYCSSETSLFSLFKIFNSLNSNTSINFSLLCFLKILISGFFADS